MINTGWNFRASSSGEMRGKRILDRSSRDIWGSSSPSGPPPRITWSRPVNTLGIREARQVREKLKFRWDQELLKLSSAWQCKEVFGEIQHSVAYFLIEQLAEHYAWSFPPATKAHIATCSCKCTQIGEGREKHTGVDSEKNKHIHIIHPSMDCLAQLNKIG